MPLEKQKTALKDGDILVLPVDKIMVFTAKYRKPIDDEYQQTLNESIRDNGLLNPVTIGRFDNQYYLIAGFKRFRAIKACGKKNIPCVFKVGDSYKLALIENMHRNDLTPIQLSEVCLEYKLRNHLNQKQLAEKLKKSTTNINDILRLNELPDFIKDECRDSYEYSRRFLLDILKKKTHKKMIECFQKSKRKGDKENSDVKNEKAKKDEKAEGSEKLVSYEILIQKFQNLIATTEKITLSNISNDKVKEINVLYHKLGEMLRFNKNEKSRMRDFKDANVPNFQI